MVTEPDASQEGDHAYSPNKGEIIPNLKINTNFKNEESEETYQLNRTMRSLMSLVARGSLGSMRALRATKIPLLNPDEEEKINLDYHIKKAQQSIQTHGRRPSSTIEVNDIFTKSGDNSSP